MWDNLWFSRELCWRKAGFNVLWSTPSTIIAIVMSSSSPTHASSWYLCVVASSKSPIPSRGSFSHCPSVRLTLPLVSLKILRQQLWTWSIGTVFSFRRLSLVDCSTLCKRKKIFQILYAKSRAREERNKKMCFERSNRRRTKVAQ